MDIWTQVLLLYAVFSSSSCTDGDRFGFTLIGLKRLKERPQLKKQPSHEPSQWERDFSCCDDHGENNCWRSVMQCLLQRSIPFHSCVSMLDWLLERKDSREIVSFTSAFISCNDSFLVLLLLKERRRCSLSTVWSFHVWLLSWKTGITEITETYGHLLHFKSRLTRMTIMTILFEIEYETE